MPKNSYRPERVLVQNGAEAYPMTEAILNNLGADVPVERFDSEVEGIRRRFQDRDFSSAKRTLVIAPKKGPFIKKCPGTKGEVCCNYHVADFIENCDMDCSYCFLQQMLTNPYLKIHPNVEDLMEEIDGLLNAAPDRILRFGTGEMSDSLSLDWLTGFTDRFLPFVAARENLVFEMKTKTDCIDGLKRFRGLGNVVIAWSLNPQSVVDRNEPGTASLQNRISAAAECAGLGYRVAFHFDPIIYSDTWETDYHHVVDLLFDHIPTKRIGWISLGSLRFHKGNHNLIREQHADNRDFRGEMIGCSDGKFRYLRPLRVSTYKSMLEKISSFKTPPPVYLCMEAQDMWRSVFGNMSLIKENPEIFA